MIPSVPPRPSFASIPSSGVHTSGPTSAATLRICPECQTVYQPAVPGTPPTERCQADACALVLQHEWEASGHDPILGRTIAGRFTVVASLGAGSMGAVYKAYQETVGRWVALKIMRYDRANDSDARARFEREARSTSSLQSPHTVTVYDFGQAQDGSVFLAMELLEGESLGARLRRLQRLPLHDAVRIAREALLSLAEAHEKGIIHRDLKPDNLYLARVPDVAGGAREVCKLLDFGIAKVMREESAIDALETQAGTVFGTPRYMSPEQAQGKQLDARSDLYSLGVILYQMVVGKPPFDDEEAVVVMARHIKHVPKPPREAAPEVPIPTSLERIILRALAKDPRDRPPAAETFIRALDRIEIPVDEEGTISLDAELAGEDDDPFRTMAVPPVRRGKGLLVAMVIGATALVLVIGVLVGSRLLGGKSEASVPASAAAPPVASAPATAAPAASSAPETVAIDQLPVVGGPTPRTPPPGPRTSTGRPPAPPKTGATAATTAPPPPPPKATSGYERFE